MSLLLIPTSAGAGAGEYLDIEVTAGTDLAIRDVVYIDVLGRTGTPGRLYKADADLPITSTLVWLVGFVTAAVSEGETATVRIYGKLGGFSGLTPGAVQYIDTVDGLLTESISTHISRVGVALSATELLINSRGDQRTLYQGTKGYIPGGFTPSVTDLTDKITYAIEVTAAQTTATISTARANMAGLSDVATRGYCLGGPSPYLTTADKIAFSSDVASAQTTADLSVGREFISGLNKLYEKGYIGGGRTADTPSAMVVSTDILTFSTQVTAAVTTADLSQARFGYGSVSEGRTKGYWSGGYTADQPAVVATGDKVTYSSDTTSAQTTANLTSARAEVTGVNGGTSKGYFLGGYTASSAVATADKITFATDTVTTQTTANLSLARHGPAAGLSEGISKGYVLGGYIAGASVVADKIVFSVDSTAAQTTANLTVAKYGISGFGDSL